MAWRNFYRVWMEFLNDYKNMGGRVTTSSDAGFIYHTPGFSTIQEMELLQEAGFHPLEMIRGATMHGAETLARPRAQAIEIGVVRPGMLADLVIVDQNPLAEHQGALRQRRAAARTTRRASRSGWAACEWTIKDGIVYDAKQLLADVAKMVEKQKRAPKTSME